MGLRARRVGIRSRVRMGCLSQRQGWRGVCGSGLHGKMSKDEDPEGHRPRA